MKLSRQIKPISYLKAHAAEIVRKLNEHGEPLVITQNGEAKVVIQDIESYEQTQETMALLKILALGIREYREIFFKPYRITYLVMDKNVYVLLITEGLREMQTLS